MDEINPFNISGSYVTPVSIHEPSEFIADVVDINYFHNRSAILSPLLNRIFNEDCINGMRGIPDNSIDAVITDPPYGIAKKNPLIGKSHGKIKTIDSAWDLFDSTKSFQSFTQEWLIQCLRVLKPNGSIAVWGNRVSIFDIQPVLSQYFPKFLDMFTWIKRDAPPNITQRGLAASTEFCLIYCKSETKWTFNGKELKKYNNGKQARNYLDIQRTMPANERTGHPTQKKIETQQFLVEMISNKGDIVLDPFIGSGTVPVACVKTDRNFIGFEKNKKYADIAVERLKRIK